MSRPRFVLVPQHFGSMVFDRQTSRYLPFDHELSALLLGARDRPITEAFALLSPERVSLLEAFLDDFYPRGLFTHDLRFAGAVVDAAPPADHLTGPLAVHLEVSASCNLTCTHCFAGELPRREAALTLTELDGLFARLARMGSFRLGLTGGEPLLRRDLLAVIDLATSHGLHPCLTTNGLLLDERLAREFGRRELVWLNVSLDGATAATNDRTRGAGTFERVREKLAMLAQHARFTLAFTLTSGNAHEAQACAELARDVGAHTAVFRPMYPAGVALNDLTQMPTWGQYQDALRSLDDGSAQLRGLDPFGPQPRAESHAKVFSNHGCGAGNTVCSISLGGDVNPCSFLGAGFVADNVRRRPFEDIWHESETFRTMRGLPGDGTGTATFGGGCRARSLALAGDVNAPDPWLHAHARDSRSSGHPLVVLRARRSAS